MGGLPESSIHSRTNAFTICASSCILPRTTSAVSASQPKARLKLSSNLPPFDKTDRFIPETDPRRTKALWNRVMSQDGPTRETKASTARKLATGLRRGNNRGRGNARAIPNDASTSHPTETDRSLVSKRTTAAKPADSDFKTQVLEKRGILIDFMSPSKAAFAHFDTSSPRTPRSLHYNALSKDTFVWLDVDDEAAEAILREYKYMKHHSLCEAEFATYAKETLLKRDPRSLEPIENRVWRTERMIELVAKPDEALLWEAPPIVDQTSVGKRYEFDIRPDCSYWLSCEAFNPGYKDQVSEWTYVMDDRITCPYFTVEFKKDDSTFTTATNQVATASALALYNRFLLKQKRLKATDEEPSSKDLNNLRHYGLTFTGDLYTFWCTIPTISDNFSWKGCKMVRAYQGKCNHLNGLNNLVDYINEIHHWGLTVHGKGCEDDVKHCIQRKSPGIRTSLG